MLTHTDLPRILSQWNLHSYCTYCSYMSLHNTRQTCARARRRRWLARRNPARSDTDTDTDTSTRSTHGTFPSRPVRAPGVGVGWRDGILSGQTQTQTQAQAQEAHMGHFRADLCVRQASALVGATESCQVRHRHTLWRTRLHLSWYPAFTAQFQ